MTLYVSVYLSWQIFLLNCSFFISITSKGIEDSGCTNFYIFGSKITILSGNINLLFFKLTEIYTFSGEGHIKGQNVVDNAILKKFPLLNL
jgi:hypothetical protein